MGPKISSLSLSSSQEKFYILLKKYFAWGIRKDNRVYKNKRRKEKIESNLTYWKSQNCWITPWSLVFGRYDKFTHPSTILQLFFLVVPPKFKRMRQWLLLLIGSHQFNCASFKLSLIKSGPITFPCFNTIQKVRMALLSRLENQLVFMSRPGHQNLCSPIKTEKYLHL